MKQAQLFPRDVCVIGGGGHVRFPLVLTFADSGLRTVIYDSNRETVANIASGAAPFTEEGAQELLERALSSGLLEVRDKPEFIGECRRIPDTRKARKVLGFEAKTALSEMLDEVIPWIREEIAGGCI